jgi:hypothetical protein
MRLAMPRRQILRQRRIWMKATAAIINRRRSAVCLRRGRLRIEDTIPAATCTGCQRERTTSHLRPGKRLSPFCRPSAALTCALRTRAYEKTISRAGGLCFAPLLILVSVSTSERRKARLSSVWRLLLRHRRCCPAGFGVRQSFCYSRRYTSINESAGRSPASYLFRGYKLFIADRRSFTSAHRSFICRKRSSALASKIAAVRSFLGFEIKAT